MKNSNIKTVVIVALWLCLFFGMLCLEETGNENAWNNGQCKNCEGKLNLVSVTTTKNGFHEYFWDCPECGRITRTTKLYE